METTTRLHGTSNNNAIKQSDIIHNNIYHLSKTNQIDSNIGYQSEFARSLAYNNCNIPSSADTSQSQSLDFALSFRIENKNCSDILTSSSTSSMLSASRSPSPILPTSLSVQLNDESSSINSNDCTSGISSPKLHCNINNKYSTNQFQFQQVSNYTFFLISFLQN